MTLHSHWRALEVISDRLAMSGVTWALSGTAALAAHGIDVNCRDLDVVTTAEGACQLLQLLPEFVVAPVAITTRGNIRAHLACSESTGATSTCSAMCKTSCPTDAGQRLPT